MRVSPYLRSCRRLRLLVVFAEFDSGRSPADGDLKRPEQAARRSAATFRLKKALIPMEKLQRICQASLLGINVVPIVRMVQLGCPSTVRASIGSDGNERNCGFQPILRS